MGEYGEAMYQTLFEEGMHKSAVEISINLIKMKLCTLEEISQASELPLEEVKELAVSIEMNDTNGTNSTTE